MNIAQIEQTLRQTKRCVIRTDGTIEPQAQPLSRPDALHMLITASGFDSVNLRHLGEPLLVMMVDDRGYETNAVQHNPAPQERLGGLVASTIELVPTKALKPVNEIATALYHANCIPGTTHQIVGDVYICPDEDFA